MMPGIHSTVTLLDPLTFYSACILFHTWADSVGSFASAAIATIAVTSRWMYDRNQFTWASQTYVKARDLLNDIAPIRGIYEV